MLYLSRQLLRCNERGGWALPTLTLKITTKTHSWLRRPWKGAAPKAGGTHSAAAAGHPRKASQRGARTATKKAAKLEF